jgi:hypothetical protein
MNLFSLAAQDNERITSHASTSLPVTLTEPDATEYEIRAHVYRIEEQVDPETGARIYNPATMIAYSTASYPVPEETWTATVTVNGDEVTGEIVNIRRDRTLGMVTLQVELDE